MEGGKGRRAITIAAGDASSDFRILKQAKAAADAGWRVELLHFPQAPAAERRDRGEADPYAGVSIVDVPWLGYFRLFLAAGLLAASAGLVLLLVILVSFGVLAGAGALALAFAGAGLLYWATPDDRAVKTLLSSGRPSVIAKGVLDALRLRAKRMALASSLARREDAALLHVHEAEALALAGPLISSSREGAPFIYDAHEVYEHMARSTPWESRGAAAVHRAFIPKAAAVLTVSEGLARYYQRAYDLREPPAVVANAVDPVPAAPYDGRLHAAAGFDDDAPIVLYHGGFQKDRGLEELVDAAAAFGDWRLVLMGGGALQPALVDAAARVNAGERKVAVIPSAPHRDLARWLRGARLGVIPYEDMCLNHRHCAPNKLWELPAAGVPVLARDLEHLGGVIRARGLGWTFPADGGPAEIAAAVAGVDDAGLAAARAACAAFIAEDNWDFYAGRQLAVYEKVAGARA